MLHLKIITLKPLSNHINFLCSFQENEKKEDKIQQHFAMIQKLFQWKVADELKLTLYPTNLKPVN